MINYIVSNFLTNKLSTNKTSKLQLQTILSIVTSIIEHTSAKTKKSQKTNAIRNSVLDAKHHQQICQSRCEKFIGTVQLFDRQTEWRGIDDRRIWGNFPPKMTATELPTIPSGVAGEGTTTTDRELSWRIIESKF